MPVEAMAAAVLDLVGPFAVGVGTGIYFFVGLWWTVRRLPTTDHPALLMLGSFGGRTGGGLLAFYWVLEGLSGGTPWTRLFASLLGFLLARTVLLQRWRPQSRGPALAELSRRELTDGN